MIAWLVFLCACGSGSFDVTYHESDESPEGSASSPPGYVAGDAIEAWGPCEAEEDEPDPVGCCLDECDAVAFLCERCGEDANVCSAAVEACERTCKSWCDADGCQDFDPVGESSFAECAEIPG